MTDDEIRSLQALVEQWRKTAASQGAIYASGIFECADELDALLRSQQGHRGTETRKP